MRNSINLESDGNLNVNVEDLMCNVRYIKVASEAAAATEPLDKDKNMHWAACFMVDNLVDQLMDELERILDEYTKAAAPEAEN